MATGDNVLTAISVGRECNIIDAACDVFLGDVKKVNGKDVVVWRSTKNTKRKLNKKTLTPITGEEDLKKSDLQNSKLNSLKMSRNQNEMSISDIVDIDVENPWLHPPENYGVAITGKAFDILVNDPDSQHILKKVLLKAQIYARMSPDDKAKLVNLLQDYCKTEVGMCGDGANDCCALKTADMGLSLSEAEASIAAPFTS